MRVRAGEFEHAREAKFQIDADKIGSNLEGVAEGHPRAVVRSGSTPSLLHRLNVNSTSLTLNQFHEDLEKQHFIVLLSSRNQIPTYLPDLL